MRKVKLSKKNQVRNRMIRNLLSSLVLFEQIQTTPQKAKALKSKASSFFGKINKVDSEVSLKRYISSYLYGGSKQKAYDYRSKFESIKTYKVKNRFGDNAEQMIVKLVFSEEKKAEKTVTEKAKPKKLNKKSK